MAANACKKIIKEPNEEKDYMILFTLACPKFFNYPFEHETATQLI